MIDERDRFIQELDAAREAVNAALSGFEVDREIYPGWTLKQFLAHVTGWDEAVAASLRAYVRGESAALASYRGIDEYNARSVETREELSYAQTRREWELAREELKAAIRAIPDALVSGNVVAPWGSRRTVAKLVSVLIHHERKHADEIRERT